MQLPRPLVEVLQAVRAVGRPRVVGGCVRDWLLGLKPKDFDIEVPGADFEMLQRVLAPFGSTDVVGKSFGVIKLRLEGIEYDFSLPRRESKTGAGHRGFAVEPEPNLSDFEAAARRDFTVNAIAYDPFSNSLIDPHDGEKDLRARILRHTSNAFTEDPLRVLRAFQLAARFDFTLAPETAALCRSIKTSFYELPVERVWNEWAKWAENLKRLRAASPCCKKQNGSPISPNFRLWPVRHKTRRGILKETYLYIPSIVAMRWFVLMVGVTQNQSGAACFCWPCWLMISANLAPPHARKNVVNCAGSAQDTKRRAGRYQIYFCAESERPTIRSSASVHSWSTTWSSIAAELNIPTRASAAWPGD